ncbi:1-acylglycerol-3-phosphate O [Gigaspora margarita]|uniref:1-acyl-sn-glycerol-3-phosphate acyltransferase n=1 Tax=Gigaspora margarita TaxID=4874 RepID=A0A8H3WWA5_GIGMA|nr:1-acylglycerol-3-phosphate O [Gigaspora margarita]
MFLDSSSIVKLELITAHPLAILLVIGALITGSRINPTIQFFVRALISFIFIIIFSIYGILSAIFLSLIGKRGLINWATARAYAYIAGGAVGISYKVEGEEHMLTGKPSIYVCNHQSAADLFVLGRIFPKDCVIVGKAELKYIPLLNIYMILNNSIFLDRKNRNSSVQALTKAADEVKQRKTSVFIFPEGTRSHLKEAELLPFKKGAFYMAVQAGIPIVPIVVANYIDIYSSTRRIFRGGELHIKVLPPIETTNINADDKEQINSLMDKTRDVMLNTIREITPNHKVKSSNGDTKLD